jgi:hypothetical protein
VGARRRITELPVASRGRAGTPKFLLTRVGEWLPKSYLRQMHWVLDYLETGRWIRDRHLTIPFRTASRYRLFERVGRTIASSQTLYLEFGVYRGESIASWSHILKHPESRLHGFDTFTGLPEDWSNDFRAGAFSVGGQIPIVNDSRVAFFKGLFQETLPQYTPPPHDRLVVNMDADLYSSTAFVLAWAMDLIKPGSLLYFDEFEDGLHERKAFEEFLKISGMRFDVLGATRCLNGIIFQCKA